MSGYRPGAAALSALLLLLAASCLCGCKPTASSSSVATINESAIEDQVADAAGEAFGESLVSIRTSTPEGSIQAMVELSVSEVSDEDAFIFLDQMVGLAGDDDVFFDIMLHQDDGTASMEGMTWYRNEELLYRDQARFETWTWPEAYESYIYAMAEDITESSIAAVAAGEDEIPQFVAPE